MNQAITRLPQGNRRREDLSVVHFKRFLEALSAPVTRDSAKAIQSRTKFRVLHVRRKFGT
jgi:hypothetical protein